MKPLYDLRGIVTVLNTPFSTEDRLDLPGLRAHVRYALDAGVAGFLVPAMASEVGKLSEAECATLVETVVDEVAGRARVIGGASADDAETRLRRARHCIDAGCDGVLVSLPWRGAAEYLRDVAAVADLDPPMLMLQDWDAGGYGLPVDLIVRIFETVPCFRCLKVEVVPAGVKYSQVLEATGGRLHVSGGWAATQLIEGLDRGVHAFMPTGMHHSYCAVLRDYAAGLRDQAMARFERMLPVLAFSNQHLDLSIHFFKRLLHAQGIYATARVREPIRPFDAIHARIADALIARVVEMERENRA
jgi:4-hydroxy-tetrahydrodipicolinate synthase